MVLNYRLLKPTVCFCAEIEKSILFTYKWSITIILGLAVSSLAI